MIGTCVRDDIIERLDSHWSAVHLHTITIDVVTHWGCLSIIAVRSHIHTDVQVTANGRLSCCKPGLAIHREEVTLAIHSLAVVETQWMYIRIVHNLECEEISMSWLQDNILIQWNIGERTVILDFSSIFLAVDNLTILIDTRCKIGNCVNQLDGNRRNLLVAVRHIILSIPLGTCEEVTA